MFKRINLFYNNGYLKKLRPFSPKYRIQLGNYALRKTRQKFYNRLNKGCFFFYRKSKSYRIFVRSFMRKIYEKNTLRRKSWYIKLSTQRQGFPLKYIGLYKKFFYINLLANTFFSNRHRLLGFGKLSNPKEKKVVNNNITKPKEVINNNITKPKVKKKKKKKYKIT